MSNSQENQFCLAQYVVTAPDTSKKNHLFDANPILEQLPAHLLAFIGTLLEPENLIKLPATYKHPNELYQALATKADEFCPGRTTADLLIKQQIVKTMMDAFVAALSDFAKDQLRTMDPLTRSRLIVDLLTRIRS